MKPELPIFVTVGNIFPPLGLDARYSNYRVIHCARGADALAILAHEQTAHIPILLVLLEQQLADMSGMAFLAQARSMIEDAKWVLITQKETSEPTDIASTTATREPGGPLHFSVDATLSRWTPPEDYLFPVIDALLEQGAEHNIHDVFQGIHLVGHRFSAASYQLKEFLSRNGISFQWVDLETHPEVLSLVAAPQTAMLYPVVLFPDGTSLVQPTILELAQKLGLRMQTEQPFYDLIIIGAGPAGLAAAVYGASEGLKTAVVEREAQADRRE